MPRGFKKDVALTKLARQEGTLTDKRSFISLPKQTLHTNGKPKPHLILYGTVDVGAARERAIERASWLGLMYCQNSECQAIITDDAHEMDPHKAHMRHINDKPAERCDCDENVEMVCRRTHALDHPDGRIGAGA